MSQDLKFQEEERYLQRVRQEIRSQLAGIGPRYVGDDYTEQALDEVRQERKRRLEGADGEPYFGRLDFCEQGKPSGMELYIGKAGIGDESGRVPLVVDWRAPVSSLFYSFAGGDPNVAYDSPDGPITGTVTLSAIS